MSATIFPIGRAAVLIYPVVGGKMGLIENVSHRRDASNSALDDNTRNRRLALADIGSRNSSDRQGLALASYEDGGLERVFRAILTARHWNGPLLQAFKHFLTEHIRFDSDPDQGHGALCRHLTPDDRVLPLWAEFKRMLIDAVPRLMDTR